MSTKTNHFNSINKRILFLTDKIAWCTVNDKPFNLYLQERESLIWLCDKVKELSSRLLRLLEDEKENELITLRNEVDHKTEIIKRLTTDLQKEKNKRKKVNSKVKENKNGY